jgi:hypothetical protein
MRRVGGAAAVIALLGGCKQIIGYEAPTVIDAAAACKDGVKDFGETDVDCGGPACAPCADGKRCEAGADCTDKVCKDGTCAAPSCDDKVENGKETGIDCGGPKCSKCMAGEGCKLGSDCVSGTCTSGKCAASCTDGVTDGTESDVDCGGTCAGCAIGKACGKSADCDSGVCTAGKCVDFLVWAEQMGGAGATDAADLAGVGLDSGGNAVLAANFYGSASFGGTLYDTGDATTEGFAFARYAPDGTHLWDAGYVTGVSGASQSVNFVGVNTPGNAFNEFAAIGTYGPKGIDFGNSITVSAPSSGTAAFLADFDTAKAVEASSWGGAIGVVGDAFDGVAIGPLKGETLIVGSGKHGTYTVNGVTVHDGDLFIVEDTDFPVGHTFNDGGGDNDGFAGVAIDATGNVVAAGHHEGVLDFTGGAGAPLDSATDGQGFVVEFSPGGASFLWDFGFAATPDALAVDGMGNVVLCGEFTGSVDFGAGLLSSGDMSVFVAKLDPMGHALWSKAFAISGAHPWINTLVSADAAGNVLLGVNAYVGEIDFGGGPVGGGVLVAKLDSAGSVVWSKGFGAPHKVTLQGIAAYDDAQILLGGSFAESLDLGSKMLTTATASNVFLAKLSLP